MSGSTDYASTKKEYRYSFDLNAPGKLHPQARTCVLDFYDQLEDSTVGADYNVADHLPGPLKSGVNKKEALEIIGKAGAEGKNHLMWVDMQEK